MYSRKFIEQNIFGNISAFTLVELLITIAIIAILTVVAALSYTGIQQRGRDAQRKNDLNQIKIALSTYYNAQVPVQYVPSSASSGIPCAVTTGSCGAVSIDGSTDYLSTALSPLYIRSMPVDPKQLGIYIYKYTSSAFNSVANQNFTLTATLENVNDIKGNNGAQDGFLVVNN